MNKRLYLVSACFALAATPAFADPQSGLYGGAQIGYQDIGSIGPATIDGFNYGGYAGFHRDLLGGPLVIGMEANFSLGTGDLDSEYGFNAHVGLGLSDKVLLFTRAGYQWVNLDLVHVFEDALGRPLTGPERITYEAADDTDGGFLTGAGLQYSLNSRSSARIVVDTIEFDTVKVSLGVALHF